MSSLELCRNFLQKITATLDPSVWRKRARVVAYLEMVISCIGLLVAVILLIASTYVTVKIRGKDSSENDAGDRTKIAVGVAVLWMIVIFRGTTVCIDFWASVLLIKSTKIGSDPKFALERARNWIYVSAVFAISSAIVIGFSYSTIWAVGIILLRVLFIAIVAQFIAELKRGIDAAAGPAGGNFVEVGA